MRLIGAATRVKVCVCLLAGTIAASPAGGEALHDHDNGPLTGIFGLPDSTEGADLLEAGSSAWNVLLLTSSHSIVDAGADEVLILDGETTRLEFSYSHGVNSRLELGVEVPYVWHQSGSLDSLIDQWHDFFGFPDGARDDRPRDRLEYLYLDPTGTLVDVDENSSGIGDVRLVGGWRLSDSPRHSTALRFGVKLPTGSSDELHGSGGTDFSVGFAGNVRSLWGSDRLSAFYRAHVTFVGEPDWLTDRYEELVGQVAGGIEFRMTGRVAFNVQGIFRSPIYDTAVENLGDPLLMLTFGGSVKLSERWRLSLAVGEDVNVGSAPDVSFQLGLRYRPL